MKYVKTVSAFILLLIILFVVYLGAMKYVKKDDYPTIGGYGNAIVISGSMEPALSVNDLVITKKQTNYQAKDIILFHSRNSLVTHRIVEVKKDRYLTQGDANNTTDGWIANDLVEGKVVFIVPVVGYIQEFFSTTLGRLGFFLFVCFIIITVFDDKKPQKKDNELTSKSA